MAKKGDEIEMDSTVLGILAIIAGVLILFGWLPLAVVVGAFLIVFGIVSLIRRR